MPKSLLKQNKFTPGIKLHERVFAQPSEQPAKIKGLQSESTYLVHLLETKDFKEGQRSQYIDSQLFKLVRCKERDSVENKHFRREKIHFDIVSVNDQTDHRGHMIIERMKFPNKRNNYSVRELTFNGEEILNYPE